MKLFKTLLVAICFSLPSLICHGMAPENELKTAVHELLESYQQPSEPASNMFGLFIDVQGYNDSEKSIFAKLLSYLKRRSSKT